MLRVGSGDAGSPLSGFWPRTPPPVELAFLGLDRLKRGPTALEPRSAAPRSATPALNSSSCGQALALHGREILLGLRASACIGWLGGVMPLCASAHYGCSG